jgi:hypothetical protein
MEGPHGRDLVIDRWSKRPRHARSNRASSTCYTKNKLRSGDTITLRELNPT